MTIPEDEIAVANEAFWAADGNTSEGVRAAILAVDEYRLRKRAEQQREIKATLAQQIAITHAFIFGYAS